MRFSSVALAATVSAAATAAPVANVEAVASSTNNLFDLATAVAGAAKATPDFTWAKGYGAGFGQASSVVEVDSTAAADVTFSAVYTGADVTEANKVTTCTTIPTAQALPTIAAAGTHTSNIIVMYLPTFAVQLFLVAFGWTS